MVRWINPSWSASLCPRNVRVQGYYMERKGISLAKSSVALTLLSLSEFVTYVLASMLGDGLKGRLVYANVVSSSCLAVVCIAWPFVDINYALILVTSLGYSPIFDYSCRADSLKMEKRMNVKKEMFTNAHK